jgi:hypothetical protein
MFMLSLFRRTKRKHSSSLTPVQYLEQLAPEWWRAVPTTVRATLANDAELVPVRYRSAGHLWVLVADDLRRKADADWQAAELVARQAFEGSSDIIDRCLAGTVLCQLYNHQGDHHTQLITTCEQIIASAGEFRTAWLALAQERGLPTHEASVPRLLAFDLLIEAHQKRGDIEAANGVCQQAVAAGYRDYARKIRNRDIRLDSGQWGVFIRGMLACGATSATLNLVQNRAYEEFIPPTYLIALLGLWIATLILALRGTLRVSLLRVPLGLRRRPVLFWWIMLAAGIYLPIRYEVQRFNPLFQQYEVWMLSWLLALGAFTGLTTTELRAMGRRLAASRWTGVMISLTTCVLIVFSAELVLRYGVVFSNSYARGLLHARWTELYWKPFNQYGYRDYAIPTAEPGVQRVLVVGDSFVAGIGVNNIDDTFPHILGRQLGDTYQVNIAAHAGWNFLDELGGMRAYRPQPDIIIWSYFLNDVSDADPQSYVDFGTLFTPPPAELQQFVDNFYLGEFLYWNVYQQILAGGDRNYANLLLRSFTKPEVWSLHQTQLQEVVDYANETRTRLVVIVFPVLTQVEESAPMTRMVATYFRSKGVEAIDMSDLLVGRNPMELIANPWDMHPNVSTHTLAAHELFRILTGRFPIGEVQF